MHKLAALAKMLWLYFGYNYVDAFLYLFIYIFL